MRGTFADNWVGPTKNMAYEIRIYKKTADNTKIRTALIKHPENIGFIQWCRMYFTLKKYTIRD